MACKTIYNRHGLEVDFCPIRRLWVGRYCLRNDHYDKQVVAVGHPARSREQAMKALNNFVMRALYHNVVLQNNKK